MKIYPVILPVESHEPGHNLVNQRKVSMEALQISADRSGVYLGEPRRNEEGVPLLTNGYNWSVSHKSRVACGVVCDEVVGIDVEEIRPRNRALHDYVWFVAPELVTGWIKGQVDGSSQIIGSFLDHARLVAPDRMVRWLQGRVRKGQSKADTVLDYLGHVAPDVIESWLAETVGEDGPSEGESYVDLINHVTPDPILGWLQKKSWYHFFRIWTAKEAVLKAMGSGIGFIKNCKIQSFEEGKQLILDFQDRLFTVEQTLWNNHLISVVKGNHEVEWVLPANG